jgi:hypothetical protein
MGYELKAKKMQTMGNKNILLPTEHLQRIEAWKYCFIHTGVFVTHASFFAGVNLVQGYESAMCGLFWS